MWLGLFLAWPVLAWRDLVWCGVVWHGSAWLGLARWRDLAWCGSDGFVVVWFCGRWCMACGAWYVVSVLCMCGYLLVALVCGLPVTVKKTRHDCGLTVVLTVFCGLTVFFCLGFVV